MTRSLTRVGSARKALLNTRVFEFDYPSRHFHYNCTILYISLLFTSYLSQVLHTSSIQSLLYQSSQIYIAISTTRVLYMGVTLSWGSDWVL